MSFWRRRRGADESGDVTPPRPVFVAKAYHQPNADLDRRVDELVATLDMEAFGAIREKHADLPPYPGPGKYLEIEKWMRRHFVHANALGLLDGRKRSILDLGTGNGYFPFLCGHVGHRVVSVDLDGFDLFNDLVAFLGIDRRVLRIERNQRLPDLDGPFDLVTAFNVCFNEQNSPTMWEAPEWDFFLRDVTENQLAPGGEIFLKLNPLRKPGGFDEKPLLASFEALGAELNVPFVHFPPEAKLFSRA